MFQFEVVVTEKCNLACKYCYMNDIDKMMDRNTFDHHYMMLPKIMKKHFEKGFHTTFFGGEPLLNWDIIVHAIELIKASTHPENQGITIPTNGLLLSPDKIDFLQKHNVNVSLSFDGLWNHDQRVFPNQSPTFDKYMTMFINDEWPGLFQNCKIMVPPKRAYSLKENYKFFVNDIENFFPDFTLVRDRTWTDEDVDRFAYEIEKLADQVIKFHKYEHLSTMPGLFSLYMLDTIAGDKWGKRPFSCFAGCHGAAFMPDGKVYPCARFGSNRLFALADSMTQEMFYNQSMEQACLPESITNPEKFAKCQACELYKYCNSGCTFEQMRYDERNVPPRWYGEPVDNVCKLFKMCYEHAYRITETLKDDETFKETMNIIMRRIEDVK